MAVAFALVGGEASQPDRPRAKPPVSQPGEAPPVAAPAPAPRPPRPAPVVPVEEPEPAAEPEPTPEEPAPASSAPEEPSPEEPAPTPSPSPSPSPEPSAPAPEPTPSTEPTPPPEPTPTPSAEPPSPSAEPPAPVVYELSDLAYAGTGDGTGPELRPGESSWVWQRHGLAIGGQSYARGVTVHGQSSVTVDLNRACRAYDAVVGVDDLALGVGKVRFSVYADGAQVWTSPLLEGGAPGVPVHVDLTGRSTIRLVVEPHSVFDVLVLSDWAQSRFSC
ncbi:NPCBM/NEW2 domain-containing protein [Streptomyces sp. NPDC059578]|uniref:NPCBM/NEW2 domain-containing protein n=1 Tax=Streptomyces sp. NPDC059578 TaxID=3346874 RepID=UPI00368EDEE6